MLKIAALWGGVFGLTMAGAATAQVTFTDVTDEAGLTHVQWDGDTHAEFGPDMEMLFMAGGAAAGDYNNDGWCDLYCTRLFAPNLLFMSNGDGTFTEVGAAAGVDLVDRSSGCSFVDINNDGHLDLYVLTMYRWGRNFLYINNGDGTFREEARTRGLECKNPDDNLYARFRFPTEFCPRCFTSVAFGDYDLDGDLDCALTDWGPTQDSYNRVFENTGGGYFVDVTDPIGANMEFVRGFAPKFADMTGDGYPELLVAADFGTSQIFLNTGGAFVNATGIARTGSDENGMGSAVGDFDRDGDYDWFVTSIWDPDNTCQNGQNCNWGTTGNRLYANRTIPNVGVSLRFDDATDAAGVRDGAWGWAAAFFDFDNDTDLDLGMTNGLDMPMIPWDDIFNADRVRLWENNGGGIMAEIGESAGFDNDGSGKGFLTFDYDNDGDVDVFIVNNRDYPVLYRNNGGNQSNWLKVSLVGVTTNNQGVGARIEVQVEEGGPVQCLEVDCDSNFMSHNDIVSHFGAGDAETIHRVTIIWPVTETVQTYNDVAVNQHLVIAETD